MNGFDVIGFTQLRGVSLFLCLVYYHWVQFLWFVSGTYILYLNDGSLFFTGCPAPSYFEFELGSECTATHSDTSDDSDSGSRMKC